MMDRTLAPRPFSTADPIRWGGCRPPRVARCRLRSRDCHMGVSAGIVRTRWAGLVLSAVMLGLALGTVAVTPQAAAAQEGENKGDQPAKEKKEPPSLPEHLLKSAGWFFGPLLFAVSIGLVTLIVLLA